MQRFNLLLPKFCSTDFLTPYCTNKYGRLALCIVMALLVSVAHVHYTWRLIFLIIACLAAYLKAYRPWILLLGSFLWLLHSMPARFGDTFLLHHLLPVLSAFGGSYLLLKLAHKIGRKGPFLYPVASLFTALIILVALSQLHVLPKPLRDVPWEIALILSFVKWPLAYAINNITSRKPGTFLENLGLLHNFWSSSSETPFGKGWSYLRKFEARDDRQLARTQLRAIQLMLAIVGLRIFWLVYIHLTRHIEDPFYYVIRVSHGETVSRLDATISLPIYFIRSLISLSIWGNSVIALARFAGYDLRRNTINPLLAHSIADFWNRWYFYFKEVLVEFFFMPTFQRLSFLPERARIFAATLMAAGFGNYIYHVADDMRLIGEVGVSTYLKGTLIYAVYSLLLGIGIGISQAMNPISSLSEEEKNFKPHVCLGVILFFCIIGVMGSEEPYHLIHIQKNQVKLFDIIHFYAYLFYLV